jgi:hypothetical protein
MAATRIGTYVTFPPRFRESSDDALWRTVAVRKMAASESSASRSFGLVVFVERGEKVCSSADAMGAIGPGVRQLAVEDLSLHGGRDSSN